MLTEMAVKLRKETSECVDFVAKEELYAVGLTNISVDEFERAKRLVKLIEDITNYMVEEARVLDEINRKIGTR